MKVMIVVTHLLGSGHLSRALTLGRAFYAAGHEVTVVSGGRPVEHFDTSGVSLVQLPPLQSDGTNFTRLLDANGDAATQGYLTSRETQAMDTIVSVQPDALITELFPFGRRVLSGEFLSLLGCAKSLPKPPMVLASIRDILAPPSKPSKADRAEQIVLDHYHGVLVHSVEDMVPLSASWPVTDALAARLHYTGFVAQRRSGGTDHTLGKDEILVSAGGGAVGDRLFAAAVAAAQENRQQHWRILVGGSNPEPRIAKLTAQATGQNITIEPTRPDFRTLLRNAACSVSLCGYNTALDVLQTGTPALFVPFDDGGEVEQGLRADSLAQLDAISVLRNSDLSGQALAQAVRGLIGKTRVPLPADQTKGAEMTVDIVTDMVSQR